MGGVGVGGVEWVGSWWGHGGSLAVKLIGWSLNMFLVLLSRGPTAGVGFEWAWGSVGRIR